MKFRSAQSEQAPTPQTINRENTVLRQMLRYAVDRGWLKVAPTITNESERLTWRRRRHFTFEEYRKLYRTAQKRIRQLKDNPLTKRQYEQHKLLLNYIILLANTGLRVAYRLFFLEFQLIPQFYSFAYDDTYVPGAAL